MKSIPILSLLTLVVLSSVAFAEEQGAMLLNNGAWKVAPQTEVKQTGEQLSTTGFVDASWVPLLCVADLRLLLRYHGLVLGGQVRL